MFFLIIRYILLHSKETQSKIPTGGVGGGRLTVGVGSQEIFVGKREEGTPETGNREIPSIIWAGFQSCFLS